MVRWGRASEIRRRLSGVGSGPKEAVKGKEISVRRVVGASHDAKLRKT